MNNSTHKMVKNISFSMLSSVVSMLISVLVVLLIPKSVSTQDYGYYQLYLLYIGYAGFFQIGLIDGIYIRYGGAYYDKLDKTKLFSQYCLLWVFQIAFAVGIGGGSCIIFEGERRFVLITAAVEMVLANTRGMLTYVLQATNRIKEGAISNTLGRVVFLIGVLCVCFAENVSFYAIIWADIIGRCVALLYSSIACKEIVFHKVSRFRFDFFETKENIRVGFCLMLSNIASLLITGIVRMAMENRWGIEIFAKVSLTVSVSNLMVQFINAASLAFFPILRRKSEEKLITMYITTKNILMPILYLLMIIYYPISKVLVLWLPQYRIGLQYMALLFPLCIFEGRMSLLNNTFLKTVSDIKAIFRVNFSAVAVSCFLTFLSVSFFESVPFAMISLLLAVAFRCLHADYIVAKKIGSMDLRGVIEEIVIIAVFILSAWYAEKFFGMMVYTACIIVYLFLHRKKIKNQVVSVRKRMEGEQ